MLDIVPVVRHSQKHLYQTQAYLDNSRANVRLKLMLTVNYDLPMFAFTAGVFGDVTNNGLLQFFLVYMSYFMFSLNLVQKT
ncbi:hypothetical protein TYRP_015963 [Tyrophagus putrescentiae]|nr:hypothetical protein TYRP_015963 [Tyrophagus putrescentiae]